MTLRIQLTPARRTFKRMAGQTNHFLITILVGLDAVRSGEARLNDTFSTSWNPRNVVSSADRSKEFVQSAVLAWLTDALDAYTSLLNRRPYAVQDQGRQAALHAAGQSVAARTRLLATQHGLETDLSYDLTRLTIAWRNRLIHFGAENDIEGDARERLSAAAEIIRTEYQGLEINRLLSNFEKGTPTFKECSALVRAVQTFVAALDAEVLAQLDCDVYFRDLLDGYLKAGESGHESRVANLWGKDRESRRHALQQIAREHGFGDAAGKGAILDEQSLEDWVDRPHKAVRQFFAAPFEVSRDWPHL